MNKKNILSYILITPARNEEAFLEQTAQSVISQTILPKKWVIISDGSRDRTDEIAHKYASKYNWIEFLRKPEHDKHQFAAKVYCFNAGYNRIRNIDYDILGNLDADLSFEPDYIEYLLNKFSQYPELGVAGTPFVQDSSLHYDYRFTNIDHVSGACQLFRRECFEAIGGYIPIKGGGIDWVAVTMARMKGWKTRTFTGKVIHHHRIMGTGKGNVISAGYRLGKQEYRLGNHPIWELLRMFNQMRYKPYFIGGVILFLGYTSAMIKGLGLQVPQELVDFHRKEQMQRLKKIIGINKHID